MKRTVIALTALFLCSGAFSAPNGITLTCEPEFPTFGRPNVQDDFYMWLTNTTGTTQKVHVHMTETLDDNLTTSKDYTVTVIPGLYSMPPDFLHLRLPKKPPGLYRNVMTMDVNGFVNLHATRTCYVRVIDASD